MATSKPTHYFYNALIRLELITHDEKAPLLFQLAYSTYFRLKYRLQPYTQSYSLKFATFKLGIM